MPKNVQFSKAQLNALAQLLSQKQTKYITKEDILYEKDVLEILKISKNTLYKLRKQGYFRYIKLGGIIIYIKSIFNEDLLKYMQNT